MKFLWFLCCITVIFLWMQPAYGLAAPVNGTTKLDTGTAPQPAVFGTTFDEIIVQSNLNVRGKSPSSRSQRTQLFPVVKSNNTKTGNSTR